MYCPLASSTFKKCYCLHFIVALSWKKHLRVRVVKWLGFGCRGVKALTNGSQQQSKGSLWSVGLHQCKKDLLMQRCLYFLITLPSQATAVILWFSAKSIQCCIGQVLHSTLEKHAYKDSRKHTIVQYNPLCAVTCAVSRPVPGLCLRHPGASSPGAFHWNTLFLRETSSPVWSIFLTGIIIWLNTI